MQAVDWVILGVVLAIGSAALWYIYRAKKKGAKCIGCPDSGACGAKGLCGSCGCSCACNTSIEAFK